MSATERNADVKVARTGSIWVGALVHRINDVVTLATVAEQEGERFARRLLRKGSAESNNGRAYIEYAIQK